MQYLAGRGGFLAIVQSALGLLTFLAFFSYGSPHALEYAFGMAGVAALAYTGLSIWFNDTVGVGIMVSSAVAMHAGQYAITDSPVRALVYGFLAIAIAYATACQARHEGYANGQSMEWTILVMMPVIGPLFFYADKLVTNAETGGK